MPRPSPRVARWAETAIAGVGIASAADGRAAGFLAIDHLHTLQVETSDVDDFLVSRVIVGEHVQVDVDTLDNWTLTWTASNVALLPQTGVKRQSGVPGDHQRWRPAAGCTSRYVGAGHVHGRPPIACRGSGPIRLGRRLCRFAFDNDCEPTHPLNKKVSYSGGSAGRSQYWGGNVFTAAGFLQIIS